MKINVHLYTWFWCVQVYTLKAEGSWSSLVLPLVYLGALDQGFKIFISGLEDIQVTYLLTYSHAINPPPETQLNKLLFTEELMWWGGVNLI